jgi:hypothetical protein
MPVVTPKIKFLANILVGLLVIAALGWFFTHVIKPAQKESALSRSEALGVLKSSAPFIVNPVLFDIADITSDYDKKFFQKNFDKHTFFLLKMDLDQNGKEDYVISGKLPQEKTTFVYIAEKTDKGFEPKYYRKLFLEKGYFMLYVFEEEGRKKLVIGLTAGTDDVLTVSHDGGRYYLNYSGDETKFYSEAFQ